MDWWLLPFCTAISTWLSFRILFYFLFYPASPVKVVNWNLQGYIPRYISKWTDQLTEKIVEAVAADNRLSEYLTAPSTLQSMMPFIETHIDEFLRHKLGKAMPVVSMFVGDKTINQMKGVFMNELETLLPVVINRFLQESLQPERLRPLVRLEMVQLLKHGAFAHFTRKLQHQLSLVSWLAAGISFLTGLILFLLIEGFNII
jgi:hypothetical protein